MIVDLTTDPDKLPGSCDVCILGAGPAGIVSALELARRRPEWHVVLLEGGGFDAPTEAERDPYRGKSTGEQPYPLEGSRLRFLGGTSNHWGGWCRPLDDEDFAPRPWIRHGGWPFGRDELEPWYAIAARWCEVPSTDYREELLTPPLADVLLPVAESSLLRHKYFRFSPPTRFGRRYRQDLEQASNLHVFLHANANALAWSGERVTGVHVVSDGKTRDLSARRVVVALGGVESTRFLLNETGRAPTGSGLGSPALGRFFADHFGRTPAVALLPANLRYSRHDDHPQGSVMPVLALRPDAQKALRTGDFCITPQAQTEGMPTGYGGNAALGFRPGEYWNYRLQLIVEPLPNPDSRITLIDERDHLGMRRLRLDWRIRADDWRPSVASLREIGIELGALGLGRMQMLDEPTFTARTPGVGYHHMGSARMSTDREGGVVDPACRVHGVENLYVASSAVFPAFGFSNPTLTITALATRLAVHLASSAGAEVKA